MVMHEIELKEKVERSDEQTPMQKSSKDDSKNMRASLEFPSAQNINVTN